MIMHDIGRKLVMSITNIGRKGVMSITDIGRISASGVVAKSRACKYLSKCVYFNELNDIKIHQDSKVFNIFHTTSLY